MNNDYNTLKEIIINRHTTKPAMMNGEKIDDEEVKALLELADRAPTHARTEPWRFIIYKNESLKQFCADHAELYWENTNEDKRRREKFDKLINQYQTVSHLIITVMKRTPGAKIPAIEEYAAVCAAVQNILLGCEALDIAAIWSTGGMTHSEALKKYLALQTEDMVAALLFLGKSDKEVPSTNRNIPLSEKISWR